MAAHDEVPFPWDLGVFDAHCHPTDTMTSIASIPRMKARTLTVMATRGEDQDLVLQVASELGTARKTDQAAQNASRQQGKEEIGRVLPCFGWHPWFSHQILDDISSASGEFQRQENGDNDDTDPKRTKIAHYKKVLTPSADDEGFFLSLPDPKPLSTLISETRERLNAHPYALVGEIGLDRAFRLPNPWMQEELEGRDASLTPGSREGRKLSPYRVQATHQRAVFRAQLRLAGELRRAVSVHSVQAHGAVFEVLQELWKGHERKVPSRRERRRRGSAAGAHELSDAEDETTHRADAESSNPATREPLVSTTSLEPLPFPPRICMHSYSGPAEPIKQFLRPSIPSDVYFSFSSVINFTNPSADKVVEVIKTLPDDRILIESDLHCAGQQMDELLEQIARTICQLRDWDLHEEVERLAENWRRFVFG
ncbi:Cut9-interacting protein scn1 [Paecilomyces lecythidis]